MTVVDGKTNIYARRRSALKKRRLGNSELELSIIGMGCWQYGGGTYWGAQDQNDVNEVVHKAIDFGVNYFDTAEVYNDGESERSLGMALKGKRDHQQK